MSNSGAYRAKDQSPLEFGANHDYLPDALSDLL
ncbi:hypothetical protein FHW16_003797 [Phyllobacterium myrsinacearum]|uniref:Uncharacterized protein n=1 Tax=Phyllobacterium myrsinacearum TaxID=28101 RepID=A0A839EPC6_9HYPH|nr:hypothetical protein [Phyllobacterium myrsinacearum]